MIAISSLPPWLALPISRLCVWLGIARRISVSGACKCGTARCARLGPDDRPPRELSEMAWLSKTTNPWSLMTMGTNAVEPHHYCGESIPVLHPASEETP